MKLAIVTLASLFAVTSAFAQAPAKKEEAKPAATAPASPAVKPADKKAEPAKSEAAKPAAKVEDKKAETAKK
jgi:hypothetical protein